MDNPMDNKSIYIPGYYKQKCILKLLFKKFRHFKFGSNQNSITVLKPTNKLT